jgi:folate-dependent phosphoribosylglycinamide formyltransferase PurN/RimJ/RimL family protein N-acetyltransferase
MEGYLRKAENTDADLLFSWVNDPTTRRSSFDSHTISYEEHSKWFKEMLEKPNIHQFIYMRAGKPVGQVRVDVQGDTAELSYSVAPGYRMMGYGKEIIFLVQQLIDKQIQDVDKIIARVKPDNVGSKKMLLDNGFVEIYDMLSFSVKENAMSNTPQSLEKQGSSNSSGGCRVLVVTNNENTVPLLEWLQCRACVQVFSDRIFLTDLKKFSPDLILSYNYNFLIERDVIEFMKGNIINMHISLLPWNRGASPNLWSFLENTPKGVTIHKIDAELDKGLILYQEEMQFDIAVETLETTYRKLNNRIMELFKEHWDEIASQSYYGRRPIGKGSYHSVKDLRELREKMDFSWTDKIENVVCAYKNLISK